MRPLLPPDYRPSEDEEFMNPLQVEYFRQKLLSWRAELMAFIRAAWSRVEDPAATVEEAVREQYTRLFGAIV